MKSRIHADKILNGMSRVRCPIPALRPLILKICLVGVLFTLALDNTAVAQNQNLVQEIERLRRDLSDVQRYVYRGDGAPPASKLPATGQSEPESAARLQRQMLEVQSQVRELTGHIERVQHNLRLMGDRLDKLVADVDHRLRSLEGGAPSAGGDLPRTGQTPPAASMQPPVGPGTTVISSDGVTRTRPEPSLGQGSLGKLSGEDLASLNRGEAIQAVPQGSVNTVTPAKQVSAKPPVAQAAPAPKGVSSSEVSVARAVNSGGLPEGTPQQQYDYAFGKLKLRDYEVAESTLRAFVDRHPDHPLAGNAMYWMGETYYVRKLYPEAARIFLDAYQRFPKGNKAADNLFKLAKSLDQIGETNSACTTYAELAKTFPNANARILSGTKSDMKRLGCS
jgi:tol-pal system protein YbgF